VERPRYKTWVRTRPIVVFSVILAVCLALSALAIFSLFFLAFLLPAAIFAYILLIVGLSRWRFSPAGGNYQARVHQLLVDRASGDHILDVGCGSGHLLAQVARARPVAALVGLDYWGDNWEYSQELCEANFRAEGLEGRAQFVRGTASDPPAGLGEFDTVLSCLTFHEVRDTADKTVSVARAVAHVTPGGAFAFIDLFGDNSFYPQPEAIEAAIASAGGRVTERTPLDQLIHLPFPLTHKRVLGHAQLIAGTRS
jgi:SAM-dependent methyltransferase